jgi:hypothetical protein
MLARIVVKIAVTPRPAPSSDAPREILAKGVHSSFMIRANIYI